jgi:pimeloyl-ACP methyl ester carboxylesterase
MTSTFLGNWLLPNLPAALAQPNPHQRTSYGLFVIHHRSIDETQCHGSRHEARNGIKRVWGLWSGRGRGFQRGRLSKFAAGAEIYAHRVALADYLADKSVDADVQLVFSQKRRARPEDQAAAHRRDMEEAERVVSRCRTGQIHQLEGVGHFLVLEAPDLVAAAIQRLL